MAEETRIEWADHTFNPWIGCTKVSPACDNCDAEAQANRYWKDEGLWAGNRKRTSENNWRNPLKWNGQAAAFRAQHGRPPMVFCASLADVFDNQVPDEWRRDLWRLIERTPDLIWLILTKRPQNIAKMLPDPWGEFCYGSKFWPNVWFGTTVENQAEADRRIPHLLAVPAAKRFLSCEPLLGPIVFDNVPADPGGTARRLFGPLSGYCRRHFPRKHCGCERQQASIDWVIAGGESGPAARPSHPDWFRGLRDQCAAAGVPFLFKQWGEWAPGENCGHAQSRTEHVATWWNRSWQFDCITPSEGAQMTAAAEPDLWRAGKARTGRLLDGIIHDARPEAP
jgi:protein gp37